MHFRLREIRENKDITQRKMAEILKIIKSYYNYFETGERIITVTHLNNYCNIFHFSFDYVLGLSNQNVVSKNKYTLNLELIGQRIKEIRMKHKLSQKKLANILNTSQSTISSYENGKNLILTAFLYEISREFDVSADYIIGRSNTLKRHIRLDK